MRGMSTRSLVVIVLFGLMGAAAVAHAEDHVEEPGT